MNSLPIKSGQRVKSSAISDAVVDRLHQLPLQTQQQVLDFVDFLLHRHVLDEAVEPFSDGVEEDVTLWEAATDEDWLALEAQLAAAKK